MATAIPVTNWGRIVGVLMMTAGVGLFGTLSGYLAQSFLSPSKEEKAEEMQARPNLPIPSSGWPRSCGMLEAQEQATAELKGKLEEVKNLL